MQPLLLALLLAQPRLQLATCPRPAAEYDATYQGRIVLARAFLDPARSEDDNLREAIVQQLKYVWGYLRTSPAVRDRLRMVLSAAPPRVQIVRRADAPYGRDLTLDWSDADPRVVIPDVYTRRATNAGRVSNSDPAVAADFVIRFQMATCGDPGPELAIPLPDDPWLAYWYVPAAERRRFRYAGFDAQMTPCTHDDLAELPEPYYYWYDWWPDRAGVDLDGRSWDCKRLLLQGRDFTDRRIELGRKAEPSPDFDTLREELSGPLSATVLIGVLDYHAGDLGYPALRKRLGSGRDPSARARAVLARGAPADRGTLFFLRYLAGLDRLLDSGTYSTALEGDALAVTVEGTLKRSRRKITLHGYAALTDIFGPRPPAHWAILRRALTRDPIVICAGHSGIGENFRLAQIASHTGVEPAQLAGEAPRFQLIAFLSCYSYMYFGQDLIASGRPREYVFTGSDFTRGDTGALAVIDLIDQVLAGATPSVHFLEPDDFFLIKEFAR